jgi:ankyrin repeat protein
MIKAGADPNLQLISGKSRGKAKRTPKGSTPFLMASATADIPMMKLLLECNADPLLNNADGCTPLMAAAGVGVVAVGEEPGTEEEVQQAIKLLAELEVDVNAVDSNGETAMHGAAYRNFPGTAKTLHELGADPKIWNRKNKHGWTPSMIASGKRPGSFKPSPETIAAIESGLSSLN